MGEVFGVTTNAIEAKALALDLGDQPVVRVKETPPQNKDHPQFCLWPSTPECGSKTAAGKPYCRAHSQKAYVSAPSRKAALV